MLTSYVSSQASGPFTRRSQQLIYVMGGPPTIRKRESAKEGENLRLKGGDRGGGNPDSSGLHRNIIRNLKLEVDINSFSVNI